MINFDDASKIGLDSIYLTPRPGESDEDYIKRVGFKAAGKYAPRLVAEYTGSTGAGVAASGALAGLQRYAQTGDIEEGFKEGAITGATSYAAQAAGSYAPVVGAGITTARALASDAPTGEKIGSAIQGVGGYLHPAVAAFNVLTGIHSGHKAKHGDFEVTLDSQTGKLSYGNKGRLAMGEWKNLSDGEKGNIYRKLTDEAKRREEVFSGKFTGEEATKEREALGSDFFNPKARFSSEDLLGFRTTGDLAIRYRRPDYGFYDFEISSDESMGGAAAQFKEIERKRNLAFDLIDVRPQEQKQSDFQKEWEELRQRDIEPGQGFKPSGAYDRPAPTYTGASTLADIEKQRETALAGDTTTESWR